MEVERDETETMTNGQKANKPLEEITEQAIIAHKAVLLVIYR